MYFINKLKVVKCFEIFVIVKLFFCLKIMIVSTCICLDLFTEPACLAVLCEQEFVVIDLKTKEQG
jgi:hypothetical protein